MDHDNNRSAGMTPEQLALTNSQSTAILKDALAAILKEVVGPLMAQMQAQNEANALTPEKIRLLKEPYVDEKLAAREKREAQQTREQEIENRKILEEMKASCPHRHPTGTIAVCLVHNYPDRQPRGLCPLCGDLIYPRQWVIGAPDQRTGKTAPFLQPAHKDYAMVLQLEVGRPAGAF